MRGSESSSSSIAEFDAILVPFTVRKLLVLVIPQATIAIYAIRQTSRGATGAGTGTAAGAGASADAVVGANVDAARADAAGAVIAGAVGGAGAEAVVGAGAGAASGCFAGAGAGAAAGASAGAVNAGTGGRGGGKECTRTDGMGRDEMRWPGAWVARAW